MFYSIEVQPTKVDSTPIVTGGGRDLKVVAYLANVAVKELEANPGEQVRVTLARGQDVITHFEGEASDAGLILKARIAKLRADQPVNARPE